MFRSGIRPFRQFLRRNQKLTDSVAVKVNVLATNEFYKKQNLVFLVSFEVFRPNFKSKENVVSVADTVSRNVRSTTELVTMVHQVEY